MPSDFECSGFETHLEKGVVSTKTNVYGAELELRTPEKMLFSSQAKKRTYRSMDSVCLCSLHYFPKIWSLGIMHVVDYGHYIYVT